MVKVYSVTLRGAGARGRVVSATALHELLGVLLEACQGALRLAISRRSSAPTDAEPVSIRGIGDFELAGIEEGSTRVVVQASPIGELLPARLVPVVGADTTAFDLFLAGLRDAVRADLNSHRYDAALLDTYGKLGSLLALGFEDVELGGEPPCRIDAAALQSIAVLRRGLPKPHQVRVAGPLEAVPHAAHAFTIRLADGVVYGSAVSPAAREQLAASLGTHVVVSGLAIFRPSGVLSWLEAQRIDAADERASVWRHMPRPLLEAAEPGSSYRVRQSPKSGLAAIMSKWPGDETDDEIDELLEQLS